MVKGEYYEAIRMRHIARKASYVKTTAGSIFSRVERAIFFRNLLTEESFQALFAAPSGCELS
jgi:hypothetical protein